MIKVRKSTFETNSSSSHSLVVCDAKTWIDFANGKLFYNVLHESNGYPEFCTWLDIKDYIKNRIDNVEFPENWQEMSKEELKRYKEVTRHHRLGFFPITFYSIDELDSYEYNAEKKEASLDYYFG